MADFRREYRCSGDELATLAWLEFLWLLQGLSTDARFVQAWQAQPKTLHDPEDRAALIAAARR